MAGLPPMKFLRSPTTALPDPLQPNIVGGFDESHRIAPSLPTGFEQHRRIEQDGFAVRIGRASDLIDNAPLDLRMDDLFQRVPRGAMGLSLTEDSSGECPTLHFPLRVEDVFTKRLSQQSFHFARPQSFVPESIGIDDMDVGVSLHPPRDVTLSRADPADNPHDRNATMG